MTSGVWRIVNVSWTAGTDVSFFGVFAECILGAVVERRRGAFVDGFDATTSWQFAEGSRDIGESRTASAGVAVLGINTDCVLGTIHIVFFFVAALIDSSSADSSWLRSRGNIRISTSTLTSVSFGQIDTFSILSA